MSWAAVMAAGAVAIAGSAGAPIYTGPGTYNQVGGTTFGPNGSTQHTLGGTVFVQPGFAPGAPARSATTYRTTGRTTFASDGTIYTTIGKTTFGSDGAMSTAIGGATFITGPDGKTATCRKIGGTTFCN